MLKIFTLHIKILKHYNQLREAEVLIAKHQYKKSLELINQYSKNSKEYNTYQKVNSLKAICFQNLKEKDSAVKYSRKFLSNFKKQRNNKERLIAIYNILSNYSIGKLNYGLRTTVRIFLGRFG